MKKSLKKKSLAEVKFLVQKKVPQTSLFGPTPSVEGRPLFPSPKGKRVKNVIFHDFFKSLLDVSRWYCRYVEMFLGPLEGVSMPRTHFDQFQDVIRQAHFHPKSGH